MATTNINVSAPTITLANPEVGVAVNIPDYSTVAYAPSDVTIGSNESSSGLIVGNPDYNTVVNVQTDIPLSSYDTSLDINVVLTNLGEESLPEPSLFKYNEDSASSLDLISKLIAPKYLETKTLTERLAFTVNKIALDTSAITETLSFNASTKYFDTSTVSEKVSLDFTNVELDNFSVSDVMSHTWNIFREYTDSVDTTDDVLGDANIDDDQYVTFGKGIIDFADASDILVTTWGIDRDYSDSSSISEFRALSVTKGLFDNSALTERLQFDFTNVRSDTVDYSDILTTTWDIDRDYLDSGFISDNIYLSVNKGLYDNSSLSEQVAFDFTNVELDTVDYSDVLTTTWDIDRDYFDNSNISERLSILTSKIVYDSAVASDLLVTTWDISRNYYDSIDTTDDILGEANIDDDQYVTFGKGVIDSSYLSDILSKTWDIDRDYFDTGSIIDQPYITTIKSLNDTSYATERLQLDFTNVELDSASISERLAFDFINVEIDSTSLSEQVAFDFTNVELDTVDYSDVLTTTWDIDRDYTDTSYSTDSISLNSNKGAIESATISEQVAFDFTNVELDTVDYSDILTTTWDIDRDFIDSASLSDTLSKTSNVGVLDTIQTTDDVLGLANIDDDQYVTFGKGVLDSAAISEIISFLFIVGRLLTDTATVSETRTAVVQNYYSSDFVVPYYVGTLYTV